MHLDFTNSNKFEVTFKIFPCIQKDPLNLSTPELFAVLTHTLYQSVQAEYSCNDIKIYMHYKGHKVFIPTGKAKTQQCGMYFSTHLELKTMASQHAQGNDNLTLGRYNTFSSHACHIMPFGQAPYTLLMRKFQLNLPNFSHITWVTFG